MKYLLVAIFLLTSCSGYLPKEQHDNSCLPVVASDRAACDYVYFNMKWVHESDFPKWWSVWDSKQAGCKGQSILAAEIIIKNFGEKEIEMILCRSNTINHCILKVDNRYFDVNHSIIKTYCAYDLEGIEVVRTINYYSIRE